MTPNSLPLDSGRFAPQTELSRGKVILHLLLVVLMLYIFLVGVNALSGGIKGLGKGVMDDTLGQTMNPMLGLLVGILATTLVQSSSVTTSLIVGLVASGQISVASAVPMIMGANIGTTVTNTIASLAHATHSGEFRRAFAAATCHDFFNFLAVATLLPMELATRAMFGKGALETLSGWVAGLITSGSGTKYKSPVKAAFKWGASKIQGVAEWVFPDNHTAMCIATSILGVAVIFLALTAIVKLMRSLVLTKLEQYVNRFLGSGGPIGILVGIVVTVMVQSSSITTSVLVPLAGAGLVTLAQIYPITLGANLGTTITALLASAAATGDAAIAARQIALVHLFFNISGMAVWYAPSFTRRAPLYLAERLAAFAEHRRRWAIAYVAFVFYGLPALAFYVSEGESVPLRVLAVGLTLGLLLTSVFLVRRSMRAEQDETAPQP
jgi:sodium-dependent phosphate cotransporter